MQTPPGANLALAAAAAILLSALPAADAQSQILVHPLRVSLSGVTQGVDPADGDQIAMRVTGRDRDLVNLGQGFEPERQTPRNEILALLLDCASLQGRIVIYDTLLGTVLVELTAVIDFSGGAITGERSGLLMTSDVRGSIMFNDTPGVANSIEAGQAQAVMQIKYDDLGGTQCPLRARGVMLGTIDVMVDGQFQQVLFGSARLNAGPPVGVVGIL